MENSSNRNVLLKKKNHNPLCHIPNKSNIFFVVKNSIMYVFSTVFFSQSFIKNQVKFIVVINFVLIDLKNLKKLNYFFFFFVWFWFCLDSIPQSRWFVTVTASHKSHNFSIQTGRKAWRYCCDGVFCQCYYAFVRNTMEKKKL